jgi:hypothetical protein
MLFFELFGSGNVRFESFILGIGQRLSKITIPPVFDGLLEVN